MTTDVTVERLPMPISYFKLILRCFGTDSERRASIFAGTGVTETMLRDPTAEITLAQQLRQIANVNVLVGADWPLLPALRTIQMHGTIGVAAMSAPDIGAAMTVLAELAAVHGPFSRPRLHRHGHSLELEFRLEVALDVTLSRPMIELTLLGVHEIIVALLGRPPVEARFEFACAPPPHADRMRSALTGVISYDAHTNSIAIPREWASIASPFANPILFTHTRAELQLALQRLTAPLTARGSVERLLAAMPDGRIDATAVAQQLGVSQRTMVRRLGEVGTTYRALLDAEIRRRAQRLLASGGLSRATIAARLGYQDPTSFSRACRRWSRI